jgi:hypothetical protein
MKTKEVENSEVDKEDSSVMTKSDGRAKELAKKFNAGFLDYLLVDKWKWDKIVVARILEDDFSEVELDKIQYFSKDHKPIDVESLLRKDKAIIFDEGNTLNNESTLNTICDSIAYVIFNAGNGGGKGPLYGFPRGHESDLYEIVQLDLKQGHSKTSARLITATNAAVKILEDAVAALCGWRLLISQLANAFLMAGAAAFATSASSFISGVILALIAGSILAFNPFMLVTTLVAIGIALGCVATGVFLDWLSKHSCK